MSRERVILKGELVLEKGDGRDRLVSALDMHLLTGGGRVTPGLYRIEIVRIGPVPKDGTDEQA